MITILRPVNGIQLNNTDPTTDKKNRTKENPFIMTTDSVP
jgi:hypothetical protein